MFQKALDYTLVGLDNTFCFLDDILIVSKGSYEEHMQLVKTCLKKLDDENLAISLKKCEFAKHSIKWLGFAITETGLKPLNSKTSALLKLDAPKTQKQLRSFMGAVHHLLKFLPDLARKSNVFRSLLKNGAKFKWDFEHHCAFNEIKHDIANLTENAHYNPHLPNKGSMRRIH